MFILGCVAMVFAPASRAQNETIPGGIDNLMTLPGTFDTFMGMTIFLKGNPPCPSCADTQIFRSSVTLPDRVGATATTSAYVGNLSLESVNPFLFQGQMVNAFATLDKTMPSTGMLTLTQTVTEGGPGVPEGTLTSTFAFTVDISLVTLNGVTLFSGTQFIPDLGGTLGWNDPDDGNPYFLDCGTAACMEATSLGDESHIFRPTPEPGTLQLFGLAVVGLGAFRRWVRF
jgi:hypothetical protein